MTIKVNILKVVNTYLEDRARNNDRDYSHFHPSEWDNCHRKIAYAYYESQGFLKTSQSAIKASAQMERIFDNGHFTHLRWERYLEATGCLKGRWKCKNFSAHPNMPRVYGLDQKLGVFRPEKCECGSTQFDYVEVGLSDPETWWAGHVDAILDLRRWPTPIPDLKSDADEDTHIIVDFKTINPFLYGRLEKPKPEHCTQMQIYLYLAGLKMGKFLYENKGDQGVKEFPVELDDIVINVKKEEALRLKYQLTHKNQAGQRVLPPRAYPSKTHQECLRCKFRGHCWGVKN